MGSSNLWCKLPPNSPPRTGHTGGTRLDDGWRASLSAVCQVVILVVAGLGIITTLFLGACGHHYNPPTFLEPKGHERVYAYPYAQPVN